MLLHLLAEFRAQLQSDIRSQWQLEEDRHAAIELIQPEVAAHGDLATNAALVAAKALGANPIDLAQQLVEKIFTSSWWRERCIAIRVAKPGFINFILHDEFLRAQLAPYTEHLKEAHSKNEKIVIEHTNVNPNKAMHIGHLRNAILGDVIRNVLTRVGYTTEVQYYVDDTGVQVADTYIGLQEMGLTQDEGEKFDHFCWRVYAAITAAYQEQPELAEKRDEILRAIEHGTQPHATAVKELAHRILQEHLKTMSQFAVTYDVLVWESDILGFGFWQKADAVLKQTSVYVRETEGKNAGCWVIRSKDTMDDPRFSADKIITKSDGTVTYTGKDIAYHLWKFNLLNVDFRYSQWKKAFQDTPLLTTDKDGEARNDVGHATHVYNVIDVRQAYPQAIVKQVFDALGYETQARNLRHVSYGVVSLSPATMQKLGSEVGVGVTSVSMSGRKGIGVKVDDLLEGVVESVSGKTFAVTSERREKRVQSHEVAVAAIKHFMLRYNPHTDIVFDLDEALSMEGSTGPYLQYAHARVAGIIAKAADRSLEEETAMHPAEHALLVKLFLWPSVLERVAEELNVNMIPTYAFELATLFNRFYESCPVILDTSHVVSRRLALCSGFQKVLADTLEIMGIVAPESM